MEIIITTKRTRAIVKEASLNVKPLLLLSTLTIFCFLSIGIKSPVIIAIASCSIAAVSEITPLIPRIITSNPSAQKIISITARAVIGLNINFPRFCMFQEDLHSCE